MGKSFEHTAHKGRYTNDQQTCEKSAQHHELDCVERLIKKTYNTKFIVEDIEQLNVYILLAVM